MQIRWMFLVAPLAVLVYAVARPELWDLLPTNTRAGKQANDAWLVASHQLVRPWISGVPIPGRPADLALNAECTLAAVLNGDSIVLLDAVSGKQLSRTKTRTTSYLGIAFRPGTSEVWASEATRNGPDSFFILNYTNGGRVTATSRLDLPGHPIPAGLVFSKDGRRLFAALHHDNEVVEIDAGTRRILRRFATGLAPFSLALDESRKRLYVSNRAGETRPGAATAASGNAELPVDAKGSVLAGSVTMIDLEQGRSRSLPAGLAPAGIAISPGGKILAVPNSHSDSVHLIDTGTFAAEEIRVASGSASLGAIPNTVLFRADGNRLYVACGGENSIAVLDRSGKKWSVSGRIPTAWFPTGMRLDASGRIVTISVKGVGNDEREPGRHNSRVWEGMINIYPDPSVAQLKAGAREVAAANAPRFTSAGGVSDLSKLGIQHVFLLIKENRTYDQLFGDLDKGERDPSLVMYGREVTPNHHALAERYVLLDNFYASGAISFEGHQWLLMGFVSDHVERALQAAPRGYAWNMGDALTVSPAGFFWQDTRRPIDVLLLGPASLPARPDPESKLVRDINEKELYPWSVYWKHYQAGTWREVIASRCAVPALRPIFDQAFPHSSMRIPDVIRAEAFLERLSAWQKTGKAPNLVIVTLTSDHTSGRSPGAPRPASMVADNDLALGRMVEGVTKSRFWPSSLILAVEDDAQDGVDHVSGRRTIALAIGPSVRRGVLDSNYYTQTSMVRTIQDIFRIQPKTRFLANSRAMTSIFTTERDLTPYTALEARLPLDDMNPPAAALRGRERWAAEMSAAMNWDHVDDVPTDVLNRILWGDSKGWDTPYPVRSARTK